MSNICQLNINIGYLLKKRFVYTGCKVEKKASREFSVRTVRFSTPDIYLQSQ